MKFNLAQDGVFNSLQGSGHLQGFRQTMIRLASCTVGCAECDTDYAVAESVDLPEIVRRVRRVMRDPRDQWIWVTGGDPADLSQRRQVALVRALKRQGWSVCVATSGHKRFIPPVDWLSVSPHSCSDAGFQQRYGNEVKLVDGLNGLDPHQWVHEWDHRTDFLYRYIQPLSVRQPDGTWAEDPASFKRCMEFLDTHHHWALSQQRHHQWGIR